LDSIAKQYKVPVQNIMQWNKISSTSKLKQGQQIALQLEPAAPAAPNGAAKISKAIAKIATDLKQTTQIPTLDAGKKRNATTSSSPQVTQTKVASKQPAAAVKKDIPPTWYVVKNGDTLTTIAQKFQASPQNIRDWNKLGSNTVQTGNKLIVKKG
jgi:membrane-bound lytic murein transglycosylase D